MKSQSKATCTCTGVGYLFFILIEHDCHSIALIDDLLCGGDREGSREALVEGK